SSGIRGAAVRRATTRSAAAGEVPSRPSSESTSMNRRRRLDIGRSGGAYDAPAMSPTRRNLDYLPRVISKLGFCSRREAERAVAAGRVTVNGVVRRDVLFEVDPKRDALAVDGESVKKAAPVYLKMHKPIGVVTTMKDPEGRPTVAELIPADPPSWRGAMPVGRLDLDSTGLLLLTNDHDLGHRISGPNHHVAKTYHVELNQHPDDEVFAPVRAGIELDGEK